MEAIQVPRGRPHLPDWLVAMIGDVDELPVLDLGFRYGPEGSMDFISLGDVSAPIMCGVDCFRRPFVTVSVTDRKNKSDSVLTLFQRYTSNPECWCCGTLYPGLINTYLGEEDKDYLARLFKHEPCGLGLALLYWDESPEGIKTTGGQPTVEIW